MSKQNIRIRAYNIRLLHNKSKLKFIALPILINTNHLNSLW